MVDKSPRPRDITILTRKFLVVSFLFYLLQTNNIRQRWARTRGQMMLYYLIDSKIINVMAD